MDRTEIIKSQVSIFRLCDKLDIDYGFESTHNFSCPFHEDVNPSARIYVDSNKIWCWKCAKAWDVIELVVDYSNMNFQQVLTWLEKEFSIKRGKALKAKFFAMAKNEREVGNLRDKVAEKFSEFYWALFYRGKIVWERICYAWDQFELSGNSYNELDQWLKTAKAIVEQARIVQSNVYMYQIE